MQTIRIPYFFKFPIELTMTSMYYSMMIRTQYHNIVEIIILRHRERLYMMRVGYRLSSIFRANSFSTNLTAVII